MSVTYESTDGVATITLDDGKVNAMALPFFEALGAALDRAEHERPAAVVIAGRPGYFSAGLNLKLLPTLPPDEFKRTMLAFGGIMLRVFTFPIPTVAAVTGHAIAGGAFLSFACDLRYFAEGPYRLHVNEVAIALPLPTWALAIATTAIPPRWHTEAIMHARAYTPEEALGRELVDGIVSPTESVVATARQAASRLSGLDLGAYAVAKSRMRERVVAWARKNLEAEATGSAERAPL
ncbi:MAG TPA: crotonase/enoyl-CoA hydratase family protein [Candidatus Eisenbacteria bacterium]|nr:crotonase/enoyl-CoA hydratase family protein [Candidatus Eisenbacteria bacterium]